MPSLYEICAFLERFAPLELAEEWDNVGLLVGRRTQNVERLMTCLTITPASAAEAVRRRADLIVTHHPLPFRPLKRITDETTPGRLLLELIAAGVSIYSPHTGFDSAAAGINQQLAESLEALEIRPLILRPSAADGLGSGRQGRLPAPEPLRAFAARIKAAFGLSLVRYVGDPQAAVASFATACGSGGEFLTAAQRARLDALITGEATFHACLEAEANGIGLILMGHYASERFAVEQLATALAREFSPLEVWASEDERDPLQTV